MLQVTVNNCTHQCQSGQTVLAMLRSIDVSVPSLCDDPRLAPVGGCRLCVVQLKGQSRPVAACTTAVSMGMEIDTQSALLEQLRRTQLRLLARNYPRPDPKHSASNEFLRLIRQYELETELAGVQRPELSDDSHPCIHVDMSRCIHCFRCVRICEDVAGRFVWKAWDRGDRTEIRPAGGTNLRDSDCVSCGACVDTCPSGALLDKSAIGLQVVMPEVRTVCSYCGTGCEMHVGHSENQLVSVRPVLDAPVNKGHLCAKGRYGWDFVQASDRMARPMIRAGEVWTPMLWNEAISFVADGLKRIIARYGPDSVGVLGSARGTNEDNYIAQKFARVVVGTNNVDCCARVCHAPTAAGMKIMLGTGAATNSFDDIELAKTILVFGANPTENHPIVGDRIRQAVRRGTKLIVVDPRRTDLARDAHLHLPLRPGSNIPLLNAMAHTIADEQLYDPEVVPLHIDEWEKFQSFIADYPAERAAEVCGIPADMIRQAARLYATHQPAMCFHGLGVTEHVQGTEAVMGLVNLALLTGNIGRPGAGVNPLRGQNNVQGSAHMGCDPGVLTGGAALAEARERFESIWKSSIPAGRGLNLMQMIDAAAAGQLKALWVIGYDVALTNPQAAATIKALQSIDLLIVQDLFFTETARLAGSVFLPACSSFEKDGTFMNSERRIQRVRKVIEPIGESRTDWEIICQVARVMGKPDSFNFQAAEDVWDEIRAVWPGAVGITYQRLEKQGIQWPCPSEDHAGTEILHADVFLGERRVKLRHLRFAPTSEQVSEEYPFLLNTGRTLYRFNAGTMTGRSRTNQLQAQDLVDVAPLDAERLGITDGQTIRLRSRYGAATITARVSDAVKPGELFATFSSPEVFLNRLTSGHRDKYVQTPEYKVTAVNIDVASDMHFD